MLKHNAHRDTVNINEKKDGLDFYFAQRAHAIKMCEFLGSVVPIRVTASSQVVSMDVHTSTSNHKFTYSVEIAPICKDDLVCLPKALAKSLSGINQLLLCIRVNNSLRLMDPTTLRIADLPAEKYYRDPFPSLCAIPELVEFLVLDIEPIGNQEGKFLQADAQVSALNATSFGQADAVYHTRTHLGSLLQPGDTALGYHLRLTNFNSDNWDTIPEERKPDVILVKKSFPDSKRRRKNRAWKLKSIAKEAEDGAGGDGKEGSGRGAIGRKGGLDSKRVERDYEMFLRELEEDDEMRRGVNLYRDPIKEEQLKRRREEKARAKARKLNTQDDEEDDAMDEDGVEKEVDMDADDGMTTDGESEFGDEDVPTVGMDELLDDLEGELTDCEEDEIERGHSGLELISISSLPSSILCLLSLTEMNIEE